MRAFSMDLRQKIISAYEGGHGTLDEVADTFEVGRRTVARFLASRAWARDCGRSLTAAATRRV